MNFSSKSAFIILLFEIVHSRYHQSSRRLNPLRVKNGRDVSTGQFPYVVRIALSGTIQTAKGPILQYYHLCTGSVLKPTATLTAGHCYLEGLPKNSKLWKHVIKYGSNPGKPDQLDKLSGILNFMTPPAAWGGTNPLFTDDLGIFTTEPIQLNSYGTISSLDYPSLFGLQVTLMGYGVTNHSKLDFSTLMKMPLQVTDGMLMKCEDLIPVPLLCSISACGNPQGLMGPGDSGGPVVHSTGIIGVNSKSLFDSYNPDFADVLLPSQVYIMPVSPYIDWLMRTLEQKTNP